MRMHCDSSNMWQDNTHTSMENFKQLCCVIISPLKTTGMPIFRGLFDMY